MIQFLKPKKTFCIFTKPYTNKMHKYFLHLLTLFLFSTPFFGQNVSEIAPPYHIKSVAFFQGNTFTEPFVKLGDSFSIEFDDLYGDEADYYYTITMYNKDWTPVNIAKNEYLQGVDNQRIMNYTNSYNTLQQFSHYKQEFPNKFNSIKKSGNYLITILNDDYEAVFSKKIIIYEEQINAGINIRRARDNNSLNTKQNVEVVLNYGEKVLQNPERNISISILQNNNWQTEINNIKAQYMLGSELIYRYNEETQFWAGNEYYFIDNKNIRASNNSIARVTGGQLYNGFLYTNYPRRRNPYTYFPDLNGKYYIQNIGTNNPSTEADYSWVYFTLDCSDCPLDQNIYVNGMFNNYALIDEYKLEYNTESGLFEKPILLKQGITSYQYTVTDKNLNLLPDQAIDGNFYVTENSYTTIVYYRGNNDRYDRVIGIATNNSEGIRN